ncbi:MAG: hypothetical protein WCG96_08085 [Actinomycetes bacterium]
MKKRGLGLLAAAGITSVASLAVVVPAGARNVTERPHWCDTGFYRSACAVINNQTEGFAIGSTAPDVEHGFKLNYTGFQEGNCSSCNNYVNTPTILPNAEGGANIANVGGVVSGAIGTVHFQGDPKVFGQSGGALTWWMSVPHSGSNHADCRTYQAEYLNCTYQWPPREEGVSKDAWWTWTVVDRPYVLIIRNYVEGSLTQVGTFKPDNALSATVPGTHSLATVPAAIPVLDNLGNVASTEPGESADTGLLTMNKSKSSTFNLEYRFTSGRYAGSTLTIHVNVPHTNEAQTDEGTKGDKTSGSYCNVGASATSGALDCSVDRFTPVEHGFNRLVVTIK